MKIVMIIIGIVLLTLLLLFISSIRFTVRYKRDSGNDHLTIRCRGLFGLYKKVWDFPVIKLQKGQDEVKEVEDTKGNDQKKKKMRVTPEDLKAGLTDMDTTMEHISGMRTILKRFLKQVNIHHFELATSFGTGDAAQTGKLSGGVWTFLGFAESFLHRSMKVKRQPKFSVEPCFSAKCLLIDFDCIISVRAGHAIVTAIRLFTHWKGGKPKLLTTEKMKNRSDQTA